jgi:hypothetical protein
MPTYKEVLIDKQIADVLTFVRTGWNNKTGGVGVAEVANLRTLTQATR